MRKILSLIAELFQIWFISSSIQLKLKLILKYKQDLFLKHWVISVFQSRLVAGWLGGWLAGWVDLSEDNTTSSAIL